MTFTLMDLDTITYSDKPKQFTSFKEQLAYELENAKEKELVNTMKGVYDWEKEASQKRFIR